jgi:hypothetical protein
MKGMRATLAGVICTIVLAFAGAWVQINNRISVLEVQVQNDRAVFNQNSQKMDEIINSVDEIKENIVEMRGEMKLKADKRLVN